MKTTTFFDLTILSIFSFISVLVEKRAKKPFFGLLNALCVCLDKLPDNRPNTDPTKARDMMMINNVRYRALSKRRKKIVQNIRQIFAQHQK